METKENKMIGAISPERRLQTERRTTPFLILTFKYSAHMMYSTKLFKRLWLMVLGVASLLEAQSPAPRAPIRLVALLQNPTAKQADPSRNLALTIRRIPVRI
jgi:hypothetical protein